MEPVQVSDQQIWEFLRFVMQLSRTGRQGARTVLEGCPKCHFWMLERLHCCIDRHGRDGAIYMSDLAAALRDSPQSVSRGIRTLEQDGLAERTPDPADRRKTLVRLSPLGEENRRLCEGALRGYLRRVWDQMGPDHVNALLAEARLLETALARAALQQPKEEPPC